MIEVRCFHSLQDAGSLRNEVNALNRAGLRPDPFSTFEFFENFLRCDDSTARSGGLRLWFLAAFDNDCLVGYMALKQRSHTVLGMPASKLDFLVTHDADRPQLVARAQHAPAVSAAFYAYLLERQREWSYLEFRQQQLSSPLFPPPAAALLGWYRVCEWPGLDNGTIYVEWDTLDAYFQSSSKKFRSNISRQMRRLLAAGEVEYLASSDPATTPALLQLYRGIEPRSWKAHAGETIGRHPRWADYFEGLLDASQPMRVCIQLILLDGVPIAGLISGAFERGLYALHSVFDDSMSRLAPGSAVALMGMRQAIDGRYAFFNLLAGFGYYKTRWQAQMSETRNAQIYRVGTPFFWHRLLGDLQRRLRPAAEPCISPVLFNTTRRDVRAYEDEQTAAAALEPRLKSGERKHIEELMAQARRGKSEFLSARQLSALMPFPTQ